MYPFQGWADLPEGLLESIIARLGLVSSLGLVAFATTCRSWHAAFSSFLPLLPPLLFQPDAPPCSPRPTPIINSLVLTQPCCVTNIANQETYQCCEIPMLSPFGRNNTLPSPLERFCFRGASYGHIILSSNKSCVVADIFTGVRVLSPQLPVFEDTELFYGALTAPLASPNSHLIVNTGSQNLFWRVGNHSWVPRTPGNGPIKQIVVVKGQVFGMDSDRRIFKVHLTPEVNIQELPIMESSMINKYHLTNTWLVACGDMLLLVGFWGPIAVSGVTFEVFRLDLTIEPALWLKVEKVENWAIFISTDKRSQTLSCMNPEVWGGRSNCIYCYNHESKHWIALELGKPLQGDRSKYNPDVFIYTGCDSTVQPTWVVPSMLSFCR